AAGIGVAMANASDDVKARADYVVGTNDDDGVAEALESLVLS
ncbi:MAG: HAD hydrolase family protein, partial [Firmicutes bacterium]|nr:HAD hydrolase family protein [Bacillota bacterium]